MLRELIAGLLLLGVFASPESTMVEAQNAPDSSNPCSPPQASAALLGDILKLLPMATQIDGKEFLKHPAKQICKLSGGVIYFEIATLNIDDDGNTDGSPENWEPHPIRGGRIDTSHQNQTSYGGILPHSQGVSDFMSAFNDPYIALPGIHSKWFQKQGLTIGDGAVVIKGDQKIVAVFADVGPDENIGEMSIKGHQLFGFNTFQKGLRPQRDANGLVLRDPKNQQILAEAATVTVNRAQNGPFIIIVFPKTSAGRKFTDVKTTLETTINTAFAKLAGVSGSLPTK